MLKRLSTRLALSHLLVIGVATALLAFTLLSLVRGYFVQAAQDSLIIQARLVAGALTATAAEPAESAASVAQTQLPSAANSVQSSQLPVQAAAQNLAVDGSAISRLSLELDTRVRVLDARGRVRSDSAPPGEEGGADTDASRWPVAAAALAGAESAAVEGEAVLAAVPLRRGAGADVAGAVLLSQSLRDVSNVMADLGARLLVSAAVAMSLAVLVGAILARGIARPVRELTAAANRLAGGDFDDPLAVASKDELGDLARAFRSMRDDLRRMLQARSDLVANVSHELRTPLTAVKGLIETLRDGAVDDPAVRDTFLASADAQTDRLIRLVNDLLVLSRADSNALALHVETVDLTALARACAGQLASRARAAGVVLAVDGPPLMALADPDRIQQVLINLLDNAIRYSPPGGTVDIRVAPAPGAVQVSVADQGPGLAPQEQARAFERFYRGDASRARHDGDAAGAGLGLSIAQALVRAHGGEIGLDSQPGRGATAWFKLPAAP